jgi:hypothetical protein
MVEQFPPDGRVVVTTRMPPPVDFLFPDPEVSRWDAGTGVLLSRVKLGCVDPNSVKVAHASADGRLVLVGEGVRKLDQPHVANFTTGLWYLHDGITGERLLGPIRDVALAWDFSPDGRWFTGRRGDPAGGFAGLREVAIYSAATGEMVLAFPDREGKKADGCWFAPDGETAAVWWKPVEAGNAGHEVDIVEIPSGRRRRFGLPPRPWLWFRSWEGRALHTIVNGPEGTPKDPQRCSCVLDLSGDAIGECVEDPLLRDCKDASGTTVHWFAGADWVAYFSFVRPEPPVGVGAWWNTAATWLGLRTRPGNHLHAKVWFVDRPSGAVRYELPRPVCLTLRFSPDGRRLACGTADNGVEVWDTDPPPRWPRPLAAGALVTAAVFGIGWWWRRRKANAGMPEP